MDSKERFFCGIDNGVTGSIGIVGDMGFAEFYKVPVVQKTHYSSKKALRNELDVDAMIKILQQCQNGFAYLERPMVNPTRFDASMTGYCAYSDAVKALEKAEVGYQVVDSKKWQAKFLPGSKGSEALKKASFIRSQEIFPLLKETIHQVNKGRSKATKDADGLLIALYCMQEFSVCTKCGGDR